MKRPTPSTILALAALIALIFFLIVSISRGALPSYSNFNTNDFSTNTVIGGQISVRKKAQFPFPNVQYEVFYEPFSSGGPNIVGASSGRMGWSQVSSGVGQGQRVPTNAPNHWGTILLLTSQSANSIVGSFCGDQLNSKPQFPPLNNLTGWTNRIIWRITGSNSCKAWLVMQAADFNFAANPANAMGLEMNTTNSNQIRGYTSVSSSQSFTNLATIVENQWHTNEMWSTIAGVISFNIDGGPEAALSNAPSTALTPAFIIAKGVAATATNGLEVDEWVFIRARTP